jgi:hypothetical protein
MMQFATFNSNGWSIADGTNVGSFTGSNAPANTWIIFEGSTRPMLAMEYNTNVSNAHQLQLMNAALSGSYTLANDIDLSSALNNKAEIWGTQSSTATGKGFVQIGTTDFSGAPGAVSFTGTFNGLGHNINNLYIYRPFATATSTGLFGSLNNATISNLSLTNVNISGSSVTGGLAGHAYSSNVNNIYVSGNIYSLYNNNGYQGLGGLLGVTYSTNISNTYSTVNLTSTSNANVGGLVGYLSGGSITNSYSTGSVPANFGGLVYYNGGTITNSFWDSNTSGRPSGIISGNGFSGGGGGCFTGSGCVAGTANLSALSTYTNWSISNGSTGGAFTGNTIPNKTWLMFEGMTRPMLAMEYNTNVSNTHQLQLMGAALGASYTLANNISFSGTTTSDVWNSNFSSGTGGFMPIGTYGVNSFTGRFDGNSHVISNLYINLSGSNGVGLIGVLSNGGSIQNLGMTNANITGSNSAYVGAMVGTAYDATTYIKNVYITNSNITAATSVGGLVGENNGVITADTVGQTYADSNVTVTGLSSGNKVGGLIGYNSPTGTLSNASNLATVSATTSYNVGGLTGANDGTILNSNNQGTVSGGYSVGGIAGYNNNVIYGVYNTGNITGNTIASYYYYVGGIAGWNNSSGVITNAYSNATITGNYAVAGIAGTNNGTITATTLGNTYAMGLIKGVGTVDSKYLGGIAGYSSSTISNVYNAATISGQNGDTASATDHDRVGGIAGLNDGGTISNSYNTGTVKGATYVGGISGGNWNGSSTVTNSYSNAAIYGKYTNIGGLLGVNNGTLTATVLGNTYAAGSVTGTATDLSEGIGGLVGASNSSATVTNAYNSATVYAPGNNGVGGIIGYNVSSGTTNNVYNTGTITGSAVIGGLMGRNENGAITNSYNTGSVIAAGVYAGSNYIGGVAGYTYNATVTNVYNTGTVNAGNTTGTYIGGVIGLANTGSVISSVHNTGNVSSYSNATDVAGVIGQMASGVTVTTAYNTGNVIGGSTHVGGITGENIGVITNAYNTGNISGTGQRVGGIAGTNYPNATITATAPGLTYNTGAITGLGTVGGVYAYVGGIAGVNHGGINNAYNAGTVSAPIYTQVGGIAGHYNDYINSYTVATTTNAITNSYNTGSVSGADRVGGDVGYLYFGTLTNVYNTGTVANSAIGSYVGGVIGHVENLGNNATYNPNNITNVYNTGNITVYGGSADVGGVIGLNQAGGQVNIAYNTGNITVNGAGTNVGGLAGASTNGALIQYAYSTGNITLAGAGTNIGGFIGVNQDNSTTVNNSYASGNVTINGAGTGIGGFAGRNDTNSFIKDAYSLGNVTTTAASSNVGGFIGFNNTASIYRAYSSGTVSALGAGNVLNLQSSGIGGFAGNDSGSTIIASGYDTTTAPGMGDAIGIRADAFGEASGFSNFSALTTYTSLAFAGGQGLGWNTTLGAEGSITSTPSATSSAPNYTWFIFEGATRPMLMMELNTTIKTGHQLQLMGAALGGNYQLANNIDLAKGMNNASEVWGSNQSANAGKGFYPIGYQVNAQAGNLGLNTEFHGSLNGNNYAISNLYINNPTGITTVGLFGATNSTTQNITIQNLALNNVSIAGSGAVGGLIGNMIGNGSSTISNIAISGSVANVNPSGYQSTGGMFGVIEPSPTGIFDIHDVYSTANVSGYYAAGLIGYAANDPGVGGTVTINRAYSSGKVSGTSTAGFSWKVGGGVSVSNSFWDTVTSEQLNGYASGGGTIAGGLYGGCVGSTACGNINNASNDVNTAKDLSRLATYTNAGWSITNVKSTTGTKPSGTWFIFTNADDTVGITRPMLLTEWNTSVSTPHAL